MRSIRRLEIENFQRFRGKHVLDLVDSDYALVASFADEPGRSNWGGKTSLIEAIRFALYGKHRHSLSTGWISRGESHGRVSVVFNDGITIERTRTQKRGDLTLTWPGRSESLDEPLIASGDAAQLVIESGVMGGLDLASFESTVWVGQKQASRMVTAKPEDRMKVVSSWIDLDAFERAAERTRKDFADAKKVADAISTRRALYLEQLAEAEAKLKAFDDQGGVTGWTEESESLTALIADYDAIIQKFDTQTLVAVNAKRKWDELVEQGKGIKAKLSVLDEVDGEAVMENDAELQATRKQIEQEETELHRAEKRCREGFDGKCPAAEGFFCPVQEKVDRHNEANKSELDGKRDDLFLRRSDMQELQDAIIQAKSILTRRREYEDALHVLRKRLADVEEMAKLANPATFDTAKTEADIAKRQRQTLASRRIQITDEVNAYQRAQEQVASLGKQIKDAEAQLAVANTYKARILNASKLFGRKGAQRRVAESFLLQVEDNANEALRIAEANLSLGVSWTHDGTTKTNVCEDCGAAFGRAEKECGSCGASRGMNVVQELLLELSDRSGAADDLAGLAFQFGAARRLREERGEGPGFAILDEPFGSLDPVHRRNFARALPAIMRAAGIRQSFIVAHSPDVLDALPKRIVVHADGAWSRPEVLVG